MAVEFGGKIGDRRNVPEGRRFLTKMGRPKKIQELVFSWKKSSIQWFFYLNLHRFRMFLTWLLHRQMIRSLRID